ncbi:hypothetical protein AC578_9677 [Pseudocercospora eumusae]|uniref:ribonuclease Z n=1 Tax=Pseudocercospora eumusae TaxID=321146 RepID=A0A139HQQ2_9PEZI|nr:hypothetical protein AC578_9677 [Pseudocercospora eumusae]
MSRPWDSRPPEGPSSSGAAPVNYFDGREYMMEKDPTAAGAPRRTSASDLAKRLGGRKPCHMPTPTATENSAPPRREGSVFRAEDLSNNGLSYEKAIDAGLRISMQPDEHDVGLKQAIAASLEPESHGGRDGEDGGDNGEGNGRDSGHCIAIPYSPVYITFTFTLASIARPVERITSLTILRFPHSINRFYPRISHVKLHSSPIDRHSDDDPQKESRSGPKTLTAISDLLRGSTEISHQKLGNSQKHGRESDGRVDNARPVASLEPRILTYQYRRDPTGHWHLRTKGKTAPEKQARALKEEILWRDHHRLLLQSPTPANFTSFAQHDFLGRRMKSYMQLLTTPTVDSPGTTLLLHFDNKRYLIGSLAEGTQRACVQIGARLLKVSECFLTGRTEWKNTGGLIGMILTLADSSAASQASSLEEVLKKAKTKAKRLGVADDPQKMKELEDQAKKEMSNTLSIFGPPNLNHTLATARRYVFRKGMPVNVHEIRDSGLPDQLPQENEEWKPFWADENIKVWPMSILPKSASSSQSPPAAVSHRKRSFDEMQADEHGAMTTVASELSQEDRDYLTVKAVVGEMFNSSWRLDTLYETALADVKLPATIFVRNAQTNKIEKYTGPLPGDAKNPPSNPQMKVLVRRPWPGALVESLPDNKPAKEAISYIIRNHMQRGTFRPERAKALKVKSGPDYSKLAKGESVKNSDGETVTSEQVMDPPRVGGGIAVVDLPGPEYIDNLVSRPEWRTKQVMEGVGAIVWICGTDVAKDPKIHAFMQEFQHLKHIISSPDCCPNNISLDSVAGSTIRLKEVDPERYIVPVHDDPSSLQTRQVGDQNSHVAANASALPEAVHVAQRGQLIQLEPAIEIQSKEVVPTLNVAQIASEVPQDVMDEARKAQEATKTTPEDVEKWLGKLPPDAKDAEVITLGTGSALPSKYRNVSSTLVRVPGWGNILLDAGENTLGQLQRVFPAEDFKQVLRNLRLLCISHMHADHQLGTTSVIKAWYQEVHDGRPAPPVSSTQDWNRVFEDQRLAVISEPAMQHWLYEYSALEDYGYSRIAPLSMTVANPRSGQPSRMIWFIPPSELKGLSTAGYRAKLDEHVVDQTLLNLQDIQAVAVQHCHGARAISITLPSGFKVSYSGDCRPSKPFTQIGKGSTVCIHEATFDDELQGDAEAKNHSTTSEALDIAQKMGAKACVLTHFSQRYQKVPVLERADETEKSAEEDVDMSNGAIGPVEDESTNPEDDMAAPLQDVAATFPDQETSNGAGGKQYDIPSKKQASRSFGHSGPPEAVKFKLQSDMKAYVAFDYMRVKVGDIWKMEHFTPALLKLFAEEEKEVQNNGESGSGNGNGKKDKKNKSGKSKRNN